MHHHPKEHLERLLVVQIAMKVAITLLADAHELTEMSYLIPRHHSRYSLKEP